MGRTYEVVVIGAGIVGSAIACHLAMRGCRDVAVLEREMQEGMGSTAKAAGGIRAQFSSGINIQLSKMSLERFERFSEEIYAARDKKDLVPVLHRFGAYLETLFGQVSMRGVLAGHPFEHSN